MFEITDFIFLLCSIFVFITSLIVLYILWYTGTNLTTEMYVTTCIASAFGPITILAVLFATTLSLTICALSFILEKLEIKGRKTNRQ